MKLIITHLTSQPVKPPTAITLRRRGAWLIAESGSWQMSSVAGPLESDQDGREYFHVTTATKEKLVVSRPAGERGMRELRLEDVLAADPEPLFVLRSA